MLSRKSLVVLALFCFAPLIGCEAADIEAEIDGGAINTADILDPGSDIVFADTPATSDVVAPDGGAPAIPCSSDDDCADMVHDAACQVALCDAAAGVCVAGNNKDFAPCDNGSACTFDDVCLDGACTAGPAKACDDGLPCTDNACDPVKGCVFDADNENTCDDGNGCTTSDRCEAGVCVADDDAGCGCVEDGDCADFEDGDACNGKLSCQDGACAVDAGSIVYCDQSADTACSMTMCAPDTGACESALLNDSPCSDGDPCTAGDVCVEGVCTGNAVECACEADADCAPFEDGDACNGTLICNAGACVVDEASVVSCDASDDSECSMNMCNPESGSCEMAMADDGAACGAGDACTEGGSCAAGACVAGAAVNCDDGSACTDDTCDSEAGCVYSAVDCAGDETCTDYWCDEVDGCMATPVDCDDDDACTSGTCDAESGECVVVPVDCEDDSACTENACNPASGCEVVGDVDCSGDEPCTDYACDDATGCVATPTVCDDGDGCTDDSCNPETGACEAVENCDDGNPCTEDFCSPVGCMHADKQVGAVCDDANECTAASYCEGDAGALTCVCDACGDGVCYGEETPESCPEDCDIQTCEEIGSDMPLTDEACAAAVCALDDFCCTNWDTLCTECANGGGGFGDNCAGQVTQEQCGCQSDDKCGNNWCGEGEDCANCAADCGACPECGDGLCNGDEDCGSCAEDCGACPECGDGECNGDEDCGSCEKDCGACPTCGDDECNGEEDCGSCEKDCGACPVFCPDGFTESDKDFLSPFNQLGCGSYAEGETNFGFCEDDEATEACVVECGSCPSCPDGSMDNGEWEYSNWDATTLGCGQYHPDAVSSWFPWCGSDTGTLPDGSIVTAAEACPVACGVCPVVCGDGACTGEETCDSCADDCGACPSCGDDVCNGDENCGTCVKDCGECACGDGVCTPEESIDSCPEDCSTCTVTLAVLDTGSYAYEGSWKFMGDGGDVPGGGDYEVEDGSEHTLTLIDSFGDGWNGNTFQWLNGAGDVLYEGTLEDCPDDDDVCEDAQKAGVELPFKFSCPTSVEAVEPPPAWECGDEVCNDDEDTENCPSDCTNDACGSGICDAGESPISCPEDCAEPEPFCGDGACDEGEDSEACPEDCEAPVEPAVCPDGYTTDDPEWADGFMGAGCDAYGDGGTWGPGFCDLDGASEPCPASCGTCPACEDGSMDDGNWADGFMGATCAAYAEGGLWGPGFCALDGAGEPCPVACGTCADGPVCGDGVCDEGEDSETCADDCGAPGPTDCDFVFTVTDGGTFASDISWELMDAEGGAPAEETFNVESGSVHVLSMYDVFGDGWTGNNWQWSDLEGNLLLEGTLAEGDFGTQAFKFECPGTITLESDEPPVPFCGDGVCDEDEDFDTCSDDCEAPPAEPAVCPDGYTTDDADWSTEFFGDTYTCEKYNLDTPGNWNSFCDGDGASEPCPASCGTCPSCDDGAMDNGEWVTEQFGSQYTCEQYNLDTPGNWNSWCTDQGELPDGSPATAAEACPVACGTCADGPVCGDGVCDEGEDSETCADDCGAPGPTDCDFVFTVTDGGSFASDISWELMDAEGGAPAEETFNVESGSVHVLSMYDAFGDGWTGNNWQWSDLEGNLLLEGTLAEGDFGSQAFKFECPGTITLESDEPPAPFCGDGVCDDNESFDTCADDCEAPEPFCGDGVCDDNESFDTCAEDCEAPPAQGALCDDGVTQSNPDFDAGFGGCETYAPGEGNDGFCVFDGADIDCPVECGTCPTCFDEPDFDAGFGGCETYAPGGNNDGFCVFDGADIDCPVSCDTCDEGPFCGDGVCDENEDFDTCADDCEAPGPFCGDGVCDDNESFDTCADDCDAPEPVCGDGVCDEGELCPEDCDDGGPGPKDCDFVLTITADDDYAYEISWYFMGSEGYAPHEETFNVESGSVHTFSMYDEWGDGWDSDKWQWSDLEGNLLLEGTLEDGDFGEVDFKFECPGTVSIDEGPVLEGEVCEDGVTKSDPEFNAGFGACDSYAAGMFNHEYCVGDGADVACPVECGTCPTCFDDPQWAGGWNGAMCADYAVDGEWGPGFCATDGATEPCPVACGNCPEETAKPNKGEVIFTEFMPNPDVLNDSDGEWIELYNTTQQDLDLSGLVLSDLSSSEIVSPDEPLVISAGGYMTFAKASDFGAFAPADWVFETISLNNGGDTITLSVNDGEDVDTVNYDGGAYGAGVAMQLSYDALDSTSNDDIAKWCAAVVDQGNGDLGTPAAQNDMCGGGDDQQ